MSFEANVIRHSISPAFGTPPLISVQTRYPRFIHAELMTHRAFSRNASSSRAIPVDRLIEDIKRDTAMPIHWGKNQRGMQAVEECTNLIDFGFTHGPYEGEELTAQEAWFKARDEAIHIAKAFNEAGYHKQIVNRILEPFSHINVLITATDWDNFFELRDHPDAQPEMRMLAQTIRAAINASSPDILEYGDWHLPYITADELVMLGVKDSIKASVARCARVSYLTHDNKVPDFLSDLKLYEKLVGSRPLHASPAEHQATPDPVRDHLWGNFHGWAQYRKDLLWQ